MRKILSAILAITWISALGQPASAQIAQDSQFWLNATIFGNKDQLFYFMEVQPRFGDGISQLNQLFLRPAIGWKLNKDLTIYQGYAYIENSPQGSRSFIENRSFQQITWEIGQFGATKVSSRTRFEQRWQTIGRDTGLRLRELVRLSHSLTEEKSGVSALGWSEIFFALNDTDWGTRAGFDRIRTFVGLEIPFAGKSTIEVGYMNQTVNAPAARVNIDHILAVNFFFRN